MTKVTVRELREQAKAAGLKGYSRMKKAELEAALTKISEEETAMITETLRDGEKDVYESLGIYVSDEERRISDLCEKVNEVSICETKEAMKKKLLSWETETAIEVCYMFFPEKRGQMPEVELEDYGERVWKILTGYPKEEGRIEEQMPCMEIEEAAESETNEAESSASEEEVRETVMIVLDALKLESDEKEREEMLRSIEDARLIEGIAKELYGADYVRELLIRAMIGKTDAKAEKSDESEREGRPVSEEEFKKAFEELERGRRYVSIPQLRKKLSWPHEEFDEMISKLRKDETIILHVTEAGKYEPEEFFYDEASNRMGMVTWNDKASEMTEKLSA